MAQNLYNDPGFFSAYATLPRSVHGLAGAPEWPTLQAMTGSVQGLDLLDLGCGLGWFCRWAEDAGARSVLGIDISSNMLERAKAMRPESKVITYECRDLEQDGLRGVEARYDVVYSSLALHYLPDLRVIFAQIARVLRPGGRLVFSAEHPVWTAMSDSEFVRTEGAGEEVSGYFKLDRYHDEGLRLTSWLGTEGVRKFHHKTETYVGALLESGFALEGFRESWDGMLDGNPEWKAAGLAHRPYFLLIAARVR